MSIVPCVSVAGGVVRGGSCRDEVLYRVEEASALSPFRVCMLRWVARCSGDASLSACGDCTVTWCLAGGRTLSGELILI